MSPPTRPIRVLIVDDSALVRSMLQRALSAEPGIEVVATAADPYAARDLLVQHRPDVMTLDVELPRMDGLTFLRKVMAALPTPTVIVSALTAQGTKTATLALEAGAASVVGKPKSGVGEGVAAMLAALVRDVRLAAEMKVVPRLGTAAPRPSSSSLSSSKPASTSPPTSSTPALEVIGLGASTGGVAALGQILPLFPDDAPGVVVVQHMPSGFTASFAQLMSDVCRMRVREAVDGDRVERGVILVAPGGARHLHVVHDGGGSHVALVPGPLENGHCPSVDVFFSSLASSLGPRAAACLLTGMGADGAAGLKALREAGGHAFAQDEATSAVWGMPGAAMAIGAASEAIPLGAVPARLLRALS